MLKPMKKFPLLVLLVTTIYKTFGQKNVPQAVKVCKSDAHSKPCIPGLMM